MRKDIYSNCRLCGNYDKLTFEHVPPNKAFNNKKILFQTYENLFNEKSEYYNRRQISNRGAGDYFFCKSCNNLTGSWYGSSYVDFSKQGYYSLHQRVYSLVNIPFNFRIKPLNVLKQVLTMFIAIDSSNHLITHEGLREFILNKDSQSLPEKIRVFIYYTTDIKKRNGSLFLYKNGITHEMGEITFRPFGMVYTFDSKPIRNEFLEITDFKNFKFNQSESIHIKMPFISSEKYFPGIY